MSRLGNAIISIFRKGEKRISSEQFEQAVNEVLLSDTVADAVKKNIITPEGSLAISAVWACVRILSETVGTLPIHLYHKTDSGREQAKGHPCASILAKPNSYLTRFALLQHLMVDDEVVYRLSNGKLLPSYDIIHLKGMSTNGYKGKSPIQVHRENLSLTQSAQDYGEKFFTQGGNMSGVFKYPSTLKPDAYKRLKHELIEQSVSLHNAHTPLLLEGGCMPNTTPSAGSISAGSKKKNAHRSERIIRIYRPVICLIQSKTSSKA